MNRIYNNLVSRRSRTHYEIACKNTNFENNQSSGQELAVILKRENFQFVLSALHCNKSNLTFLKNTTKHIRTEQGTDAHARQSLVFQTSTD